MFQVKVVSKEGWSLIREVFHHRFHYTVLTVCFYTTGRIGLLSSEGADLGIKFQHAQRSQ